MQVHKKSFGFDHLGYPVPTGSASSFANSLNRISTASSFHIRALLVLDSSSIIVCRPALCVSERDRASRAGLDRAEEPNNGVGVLILALESSRDDSRRRFSGEVGRADCARTGTAAEGARSPEDCRPMGEGLFRLWGTDSSGGVRAEPCPIVRLRGIEGAVVGRGWTPAADEGAVDACVREPLCGGGCGCGGCGCWLDPSEGSCTRGGGGSVCRFSTPVPGISVSSQGWPSVFRRGFMILLGAPPDPTTSGYSTSMYSSWSKGLPLRARDSGSRYGRKKRRISNRATSVGEIATATHFDVRSPGFLGGRHRPRHGVVDKVRVLSQAAPQAEAFPGVVALVDQMALSRVGAVVLLQGQHGALPRLGLEAAVLPHAQLDALAQAAEEGGLVGGRPAEPRRSAVAIDAAGALGVLGGEVEVLFRHGGREARLKGPRAVVRDRGSVSGSGSEGAVGARAKKELDGT
ncbi:hypothetical protein V8C44DRAFT_103193 [Trichoderma aethiopicum]